MQLILEVEDNFLQDFMAVVEHYKDKVKIKRDKNLELDPFFYEHQKQLQEIIEEIDSGKAEMLSEEEFKKDLDNFFEKKWEKVCKLIKKK